MPEKLKKYVISGGKPLNGEVSLSGGKNAVVGIIPAAVLVKGVCVIENVPAINDVADLVDIMKRMGADVRYLDEKTLRIDSTNVVSYVADYDAVRKLRASYYLIGALLGRFGHARVGLPGGCDFVERPIDYHIKGFEALGAKVDIKHGIVVADAEKLTGTSMNLDFPSVGATVNIMLAAVLADGLTVIENAGKEPHIVDIANFLNAMGAQIKGAGTDVIKIKGVSELHGGHYEIIPDQIEAGTFMAAAAATGGRVTLRNIIPKHLESISAKIEESGAKVEEFDDYLIVSRDVGSPIKNLNIKTLPYPGFPTDMQSQMAALLSRAGGTSIITETIFSHRFKYVDELRRMGAKMTVDGNICVIEGVDKLTGASVRACDLRTGVTLVIAALIAEGITEISDVRYIERGYENLVDKLRALGADIKVVNDDTPAVTESKIS